MANLNKLELQNLRHMIGAHSTIEKKLNIPAQPATPEEIATVKQQMSQG